MTMKCQKCGYENRAGAKFCEECGAGFSRLCPECGEQLSPQAKFCGECGAKLSEAAAIAEPASLERQFTSFQETLPSALREQILTQPEGENRLLTIVFADMSGSVKRTAHLQAEDAAEILNEVLKAMVNTLMKYGGRIHQLLGDGVLAYFGTPQAHENDPERAIRAAMEIREEVQELGLDAAVGINTGEVFLGEIGTEGHQEFAAMGSVVNLAARFEGKAEAGQIIVGEATYRDTRRTFKFSRLSLDVKGYDEAVAAYAVEGILPHPEKVRGIEGLRAELIGREKESAELKEALSEVQKGRGQIATLVGEAGVGKSRLVWELKQIASSAEGTRPLWLEGRCVELGMTASYWPFIDIFREHFGWKPDDDGSIRAESIVKALAKMVARSDLPEERPEEIGPILGNLLSVRFGTEWDRRLENADPEQLKNRTFMAVKDYFLALSKQAPVVLLLEDLHWADSLSLDLIPLLMETLTLAPLLLLCVYRPEREHKCWHLATIAQRRCSERYTEIGLCELSQLDSRRLVDALLTIENLPEPVKDMILQRTQGNPFFVEEMIRSLIDTGMVFRKGDVWRAHEDIESVKLPESIQSVIFSRIDRLEEQEKRVLQSAAVIGRIFSKRILDYTTDGETGLENSLWKLEDLALIYQERVIPEEEYSFKHVLTQETVYQSILRRHRKRFHRQVADAMEVLYQNSLDEYSEQLAYHWERADDADKAVIYLGKAGEKALANYANEDAVAHFKRSFDLTGDRRDTTRAEIVFGLVRAQAGAFDSPDERLLEPLHEAFDIFVEVGDTERAVAVAEFPFFLGSAARGISTMGERALELVPPDSLQAGRILAQYGFNRYIETGDHGIAQEIFDRALVIARREDDRALEMRVLVYNLDTDLRDCQWEVGLTKAKRAVDLVKSVHDLRSEARVETFATYCAMFLGDPAAIMHAHRGLQAAERLKNKFQLFLALHSNLAMCLREGSWQDGRAFAKRGLSLSSSPSFTMISIDWAVLEYQVGDFEKGAELVERSIDGLRLSKPGPGYRYALVAAGLPLTAMISGDTSRLDRAQEIAEIVESDNTSQLFTQLTARMGLGLIAVLRGDVAAASELYRALLPTKRGGLNIWQITFHRLLGLLARTMRQFETSVDHFRKVLEDCRATHHRPELAWVCCDYADVLLERNQPGDRDMAKSLLDEGLAVAHELGMRPLQERIASRMKQQQSE